jgi:hypothetical protein
VIVINDQYAIRSDESQWTLCTSVKPSKSYPDGWRPRKFFGSLGSLRSALHGILLRTSDYSSLTDLERNADQISNRIDKRLDGGKSQAEGLDG